jgi:hypothetical protein
MRGVDGEKNAIQEEAYNICLVAPARNNPCSKDSIISFMNKQKIHDTIRQSLIDPPDIV